MNPQPHISPPPLRPLHVAFAAAGFACASLAFAQSNASPVQELKKLSLEQLMSLEVTSVSREPEKLASAPSAIQVITGAEIRRAGASTLPEALRLASNLDVARQNSHQWAISARGFNTDLANKLLVLIDGRSVYTPLFSGVFWDQQDYLLEDIDRIEVISGPGGTLWGANAVNGVINITTKSADETQGLYLEGGAGSQLETVAGARYGGRLAPGVYFRVYGKYLDFDNSIATDGSDVTDAWHRAQGGFRIDAARSAENTLTLQGDLYNSSEQLVTGGTAHTSGGNLLGRWSHTLENGSDFRLQVYYDRTHLSQFVPAFVLAPDGTLIDDLDTYDVDFQHHLELGSRQDIVWGFGYRFTRDRLDNAPGLAILPPRLDQDLYNAFAQDEVTLRDTLKLTLGTKVEHTAYTGYEVEPNLRLGWDATPRQFFWAAVSRAVRAPSRLDRDISEPAPEYALVVLRGSSAFTSENVLAYEAGYRAQIGAAVSVSAAAFYNHYTDLRSTSSSPPDPVFNLPFPFYFQNNLYADTHGVELTATWQPVSRWQLRAGYTVISEDVRLRPGREDFNNELNEVADPGQQLSLRSTLDLPQGFELDAAWRWVDSRVINNAGVPTLVPSYCDLDLHLGWHPTEHLELSIVGRNLLHRRHLEYGIPSPTRAEIPRSVYGKAAFRW